MQGVHKGITSFAGGRALNLSVTEYIVMVRFEFSNGKTQVAQHDIVLHRKDSLRSVWTPRSENPSSITYDEYSPCTMGVLSRRGSFSNPR